MAEDQNASDLALVRRIKEGDEEAFREMVERYHARIYSLSYGVLRNAEDAEEATQDSFLTLYRKISTFDESKKFFSWFYRVALNQAYSRARRRKPGTAVSIDDFAADTFLLCRDSLHLLIAPLDLGVQSSTFRGHFIPSILKFALQ